MKQRGFGLLELGMAIAALALIALIVYGVKNYLEGIRTTADKAGYNRAIGEVAKRDKKELLDAQAEILELQRQKQALAEQHATDQAGLKNQHDEELTNEKAKTADLQRRVRTGELVLRDPGIRAGSGCPGRGDPASAGGSGTPDGAAAAAGGSGQAEQQGLSAAAAGFLLDQADRADEVAVDLELCWGIARDDRRRAGAPK